MNDPQLTEFKTPKGYTPLKILDVFSNTLTGGGYLFGVKKFPPLLIGKGKCPKIWLYARAGNLWVPAVIDNSSNHEEILVEENHSDETVTISLTTNVVIIRAKTINASHCRLDTLDLRPIGLAVYGDDNGLHIGNMNFSNSTFTDVNYMAGFNN